MKKQSEFPSVYAYNDFRKFLSDYHTARLAREPGFTKSEFSRMMDLPNTRSYLTDDVNGAFQDSVLFTSTNTTLEDDTLERTGVLRGQVILQSIDSP